jgi:4-amino-4-deoxy-L-arabinose transferase-like glycosyltransferase
MPRMNRNELTRRLLVFVGAGVVAMAAVSYRHQWSARPGFEEANVAIHLLQGEGFASPFYLGPGPAPPSAYCPPVYPLIIAACYAIAPLHGGILLLLLNCGSMGIIALSLYQLAARYASALASVLASVLVTLHPSFLFYAGDLWDAFVSLAIFTAIVAWAARLPDQNRPVIRSALLGAGMGLLALTNPSYVLAFPLIALVALRERIPIVKIKGIVAVTLGATVALIPWTWRNFDQFHRLFFVRDELNFELLEGNPPFATGWMGSELREQNLNFNTDQRRILLALGEPEYFDLCGERFLHEYYADPAAFWRRTARRLIYIFISDPTVTQLKFPMMSGIRTHGIVIDRLILHGLLAAGGIAGAWTAWRLRLGCVWIFFDGSLTAAPFLFCTVDDRYVLPLRAVLILFTAILVSMVWHRLSRGEWPGVRTK